MLVPVWPVLGMPLPLIWLFLGNEDTPGPEHSSPERGLLCNTWVKSAYPHSMPGFSRAHSTRSGYLNSCKSIVSAAKSIIHGIETEIPELYILGDPPASCVAFASRPAKNSKGEEVDILAVGDRMGKRGWHLNGLSQPKAVHIACTVSSYSEFLRSLLYVLPFALLNVRGFIFHPFICSSSHNCPGSFSEEICSKRN